MGQDEILRIEGLHTFFYTQEGVVKAVDGATFAVKKGRVLGIVGESGCGKSVTAQSVLRIVPPPGKIVEGKIKKRLEDVVLLNQEHVNPKHEGRTIEQLRADISQKTGENVVIRRFSRFQVGAE